MSFVNVGAQIDGKNVATKKALREAMRDNPETVEFCTTAELFDGTHTYTGDALPAGKTLSVVGPDPYRQRSWYATVTDKGKVS